MEEEENYNYINGKKIKIFDPGIKCSLDELKEYINKFNPLLILIALSHLATIRQYSNEQKFLLGVPILNYPLEYLAKYVISYCNFDTDREIFDSELAKALRMVFYLIEKDLPEKQREEILMKLAFNQFPYNDNQVNLLSRHICLYFILWHQNNIAKDIDILNEIKNEIGLSYDLVLLYSFLFLGYGERNKGSFWLYNEKQFEKAKKEFNEDFNYENQIKYINWISGTYEDIKNEKTLLNPFELYPIVDSKTKLLKEKGDVYLIISPPQLLQRVTKGIFHVMSKKYDHGGGENKFRDHFGYVFEDYVGFLLRKFFKKWSVYSEIEYDNKAKKTVDWIVTKNDKAILFEVKHPSIYLEAKQTCDISLIKKDLEKTLFKAAKQLTKSVSDIQSKSYPELSLYNSVFHFEKVIVEYEPIYFESTVIMDLIKQETLENKVTVMNICDFEDFLSLQSDDENMFDILLKKYNSDDLKNLDMKDYLFKIFPNIKKENTLLNEVYEDFFSKLTEIQI